MKHRVSEVILRNGAKGLFIDIPDATVMEFEFHFWAGHRMTKSTKVYQTAHIMEHMSFGANAEFQNEREFTAEFAKNGAYHNAYTSDFSMGYVASCADFEWERILKLQKLAVCSPIFEEEQLEAEKGNIRNELSGMLSRDSVLLWPRIELALGGQTMTFEDQIKTINAVTLGDIVDHYKRTHTIENMRFVIAGKITGRRNLLKKILESWDLPTGERLPIPRDTYHSSRPVLVERAESKSITYGLSIDIPRVLNHSERYAFRALNHVLTGTLYSRILGQARENGLCYGLDSNMNISLYDTSWEFSGQVVPEMAEDLVDLIVGELRKVSIGGLTTKELEATESFGLGSYQMSLQTVGSVSSYYSGAYFMRDQVLDYKEVPELIKNVSKRQINRLLHEFLSQGKWVFGAVGNANKQLVYNLDQKFRGVLDDR